MPDGTLFKIKVKGTGMVQSSGSKCVRALFAYSTPESCTVVRVAVPEARTRDGDREEKETYISLTLCAI